MNDVLKKVLSISFKVVTWLVIVFTVFMMIFTIVSVTTVDRNDRSIFGIRFYIVRTDSMSKSENNADMDVHFNAGDIVIITKAKDVFALQSGDVIAFMSTNSESYGETVTHMIREVKKNEEGKLVGYVTYGTNTGVDDEAVVEPSYIIGKYSGKLPKFGNFFAFMRTTPGYITCILVPLLLLILYNGVNVIRLFLSYRREQMAELQAEREKIEQDRAQNERMMEELLELKAQLAEKDKKDKNEEPTAAEEASVQTESQEEKPSEVVIDDKETVSESDTEEETASENDAVDEESVTEAVSEESASLDHTEEN